MPVNDAGVEVDLDTYEYLECRDGIYHPYRTIGWFKYTEPSSRRRLKVKEKVCRDCGGARLDFYDASNTKVDMKYFPAPGYRWHYDKGEDKISRQDITKAVLRDATVYEDRDAMHEALKGRVRRIGNGGRKGA